jgi:CheY-like chemotaxis protein
MTLNKSDQYTILVVDDEPDVVIYLTTFLEDHGYKCISASDGAEGIEKARSAKPDLICLDVSMPEKSGVKMYRELKEDPATAGIPVIIITGVSQDFEKFISIRKHVPPPTGYIPKPIDQDELLLKVKSALKTD